MVKSRNMKYITRGAICLAALFIMCVLTVSLYRMVALGDTPYEIPQSCNIGGVVYTADNPMVVLEIVPDLAYDDLGIMIGNDAGSITWNSITDKYPAGTARSSVTEVLNNYFSLFNSSVSTGSGYSLGLVDQFGDVYTDPWYIDEDDWTNNGSNLANFTPVLKDSNGMIQLDGGQTVRNYFAKAVFDDYDMEDKMKLVVKRADQVTKTDIDQAGLVYINRQVHVGLTTTLYNQIYGTSVSDSLTWVSANCDLDAEVAFYLYRQNVMSGKALVFQSADKGSDNSVYSNVSRISILLCGIDGDTFITDFASQQTSSGYQGARGIVRTDGDYIQVYYYNASNKLEEIPFDPCMFLHEKYGYTAENVNGYPAYNASQQSFQTSFLYKNSYQFNSDTSLSQQLEILKVGNSDYDGTTYLGTTYEDAIAKVGNTESTNISPAQAIRYILGDYGNEEQDIPEQIKVLEVEPIGISRYDQDNEEDRTRLLSWFGYTDEDNVDLIIDHYAMNGFIGLNNNLCSDYDLIIIGTYVDGYLNSDFGKLYSGGSSSKTLSGMQLTDAAYGCDDLTQKAYDKLYDYIAAGLPLVMDSDLYYCNADVIDSGAIMNQMAIKQLKNQLILAGESATNLIATPDDSATGKRISYQNKPVVALSDAPVNYDGSNTEAGQNTLIDSSQLSNMHYEGTVSEGGSSFVVKLYFDRNCDSLFNEDSTSDDAELFFEEQSGSGANGVSSSGTFDITVGLPEATTGYMAWKLVVINQDNGIQKEVTGAFAIRSDGEEKDVEVLQIISNSGTQTINLNGSAFMNCFNAKKSVTGLGLDVTVLTKTQFNTQIHNDPHYLSHFSMIVMGMSDSYGVNDNYADDLNNARNTDLTAEANSAIYQYIEAGNAVLFTHDCMSYKNVSTYPLEAEDLNAFTKTFKTRIGMQEGYSLTDSLIQKLTGTTYFNHLSASGSTRNTNQVKKLNEGQVTSYPYALSDQTMEVSTTHGQYFKLDLESQTDGDDVTVWYTLDSNGTSGDPSEFFALSGQDALNNYYIYSKGNVTYTSAGHSDMNSDADSEELELFVNTFIRAIMSGNSVPKVTFDDAVKESATMYSLLLRDKLSASISELPFRYTITDTDLVSGRGSLDQALLFYDQDDNDAYDADQDLILGYISQNGDIVTDQSAMTGGEAALSGVTYECDLIQAITNSDLSASEQAEMFQKLIQNELKIGIEAEDSHGASGFAIQKIIWRELYQLY